MRKHHCQVNKQDLCHRRAPSGVPGRAPPGQHGVPAPAHMAGCAALLPPRSRRAQGRRRVTEAGSVWDTGGQDRRDTGGPVSSSGLQSASAETRVAVPWSGHTVAAVCQASRGVPRCVGPPRLQGAHRCMPSGSPLLCPWRTGRAIQGRAQTVVSSCCPSFQAHDSMTAGRISHGPRAPQQRPPT